MTEGLEGVLGIAAGALGGAAVGVERQWSGHATGQHARFAGVRTFTLLGGLAGMTGWLWERDAALPAALLLGAAAALGALSNTLFKVALALVIGRGAFRRWTAAALVLMALASAASLVLLGLRSP